MPDLVGQLQVYRRQQQRGYLARLVASKIVEGAAELDETLGEFFYMNL